MQSAIYKGKTGHFRLKPHRHGFNYRLFMMYLDLAELPELFDRVPLWSARCPALAWFRREDHYGDRNKPLDTTIRDLIYQKTGKHHDGPIRLLTHLRYFGICMNPVSFYYCWDNDNEKLHFIVAEVHNTPWNETHCYVLDCNNTSPGTDGYTFSFPKAFHVSPFMPMEQHYRWQLSCPGDTLLVRMDSFEEEQWVFNAVMNMQKIPVSNTRLVRVLFTYPLMTLRVITAIYWQAFRLWLKKTSFYPHPRHLKNEVKL